MELSNCPVCNIQIDGDNCTICGIDLQIFERCLLVQNRLYRKVYQAMKSRSYLKALEILDRAIKLNRNHSKLIILRGLCYYSIGNIRQATESWVTVKDQMAEEYIQHCQIELEQYQCAVEDYNRALLLMQEGKYKTVCRLLGTTLKNCPRFLLAQEVLALAYYAIGDYASCRSRIQQIQEITCDSLIISRLAPNLPKCKTNWISNIGIAIVSCLFVFMIGFYILQPNVRQVFQPKVMQTPQISQSGESKVTINPNLLLQSAERLNSQGNIISSANLYLVLAENEKLTGPQLLTAKSLWEKAEAVYYFRGFRQIQSGEDAKADISFSEGLHYPVKSYVYDDTLYFAAVVKERLNQIPSAIHLYKTLLFEQPTSDYCQDALINWARIAKAHPQYRKDLLAVSKLNPQYSRLIKLLIQGWED